MALPPPPPSYRPGTGPTVVVRCSTTESSPSAIHVGGRVRGVYLVVAGPAEVTINARPQVEDLEMPEMLSSTEVNQRPADRIGSCVAPEWVASRASLRRGDGVSITREGKICSFCGVAGGPETLLIGGLGAQICVRCIDAFHAAVHDEEQVAAAKKASPWDAMSDAELLATLPLILAAAEQNTKFAQEWVGLVRTRGISWAEVGRALGVSRQAAWERFAPKGRTGNVIA
jgi:hypothetical protein